MSKLLLADDLPMFRSGLAALLTLEPDLEVDYYLKAKVIKK